MTELLLGAILLCELIRLYFSYGNTGKRRHFKNRLAASKQMMWDLEFKIAKTKQMREGIRVEYDAAKSRHFNIEEQFKEEKTSGATIPEEQRKQLVDQKTVLERDIPRLEQALLQLDAEIEGVKPSAENPHGSAGVQNQIDQLRELHGMLEDHIKSV